MMAQVPSPLAQDLHGLVGPMIFGTAIGTFLFGISLPQVYNYFSVFKTDRPVYRYTVVGLFILDILHTVFSQITLWRWFVTQYGNIPILRVAPWSLAVSPVMSGIAAFFVQIFYAHRVYLLSNRNSVIPVLIIFGALFQLAWAAATTAKTFMIKYFLNFPDWTYGVSCWLCGAAITDLIITASLVWILLNSKHGIGETNSIIDRLIALTIETNGLSFTVAVMDLILFTSFKNAWHIGPHLCLIKLYINSYLLSLNCRAKLAQSFGMLKSMEISSALNEKKSFTINELESDDNFVLNRPSTPINLDIGTFHSQKRRTVYPSSGGIQVLTTATLSTETSMNYITSSGNGNNFPNMRLDLSNTFTTSIVGGVDGNQVEKGKVVKMVMETH